MSVAAYFLIFSFIYSYIVTIFSGWPIYWVGIKNNKISFFGVIFIAMLIAVFPVTLFVNGFSFYSLFEGSRFVSAIGLAFSGLLAGLIFWNENKETPTNKT